MSLVIYIIVCFFISCFAWKYKEKLNLNSDSLQKQWLFKLAILFPIISSIYFMIWIGSPYSFKFDSNGYNAFLNIHKFSLSILALSPILGVFVVYAHRSLQTEVQIKKAESQIILAKEKNKIDLLFNTRKSIFERLAYISDRNNEKIERPMALYSKFLIEKDNEILINESEFQLLSSQLKEYMFNDETVHDFNLCDFFYHPNYEDIHELSLKASNDSQYYIEDYNLTDSDTSLFNELYSNVTIIKNMDSFRNNLHNTLHISLKNKNIFLDIYKDYQMKLIKSVDECNRIPTEEETNEIIISGEYDLITFGDGQLGFQSDYVGNISTEIHFRFIELIFREINNSIWLVIETFEVISTGRSPFDTLPILKEYIDNINNAHAEIDNNLVEGANHYTH